MASEKATSPRRFPGPNSLDGLGVQEDTELLATDYVDTYHALFEEDETTTAHAYMALASVFFNDMNKHEHLDPIEAILVPIWVVQAITIGFMNYRGAVLDGKSLRFGEAMGLEGSGKGVKPRLVKEQRRLRDLKLAMSIAVKVDAGQKTMVAIEEVADAYLVSQSTAMRIWSKNKKTAQECLNNFRLSLPR